MGDKFENDHIQDTVASNANVEMNPTTAVRQAGNERLSQILGQSDPNEIQRRRNYHHYSIKFARQHSVIGGRVYRNFGL